jgi:hypothetical protein
VVRAEDGAVLATADLDMSQTQPDAMGFKYVHLAQPIQLEAAAKPVVIYPNGLLPSAAYEVRAGVAGLRIRQTGAKLMADGITLDKIGPGEMIFLNLPNYPGSGTDKVPPTAPTGFTKNLATNLGVEGIELRWSPSQDDNWLSYYEIHKNGKLVGKVAIGTFYFDHSDSARNDIDAQFEVTAVDGDGNRSPAVAAQKVGDSLTTYEALGDFSLSQMAKQWLYEESGKDGSYRELTWTSKGYEGSWTGSGMGRIGRIWMQPSATYDLSRTFIVPSAGMIKTSGTIRKDPGAENGKSCFVRIVKNNEQVWPKEGWAEVFPKYETATTYDIHDLRVEAGDKLRFVVKHNDENRADPIVWDPTVIIQ